MAKTSLLERNKHKKKLIEKYASVRKALKIKLADSKITDKEFFETQRKLWLLPRNSSPNRYKNRCSITGRGRAYYRKFGVSRIQLRELASAGRLPGVTKASW